MREKYIDLMEKALSAYTTEHIVRYFDEVRRDGLSEHGFPRLTVNIGILIAHGRRVELLPLFLEMMELVCHSIPRVRAANNFSVREVVSCLLEIEKSGVVARDIVDRWKSYLKAIDPGACYEICAKTVDDRVKNWAIFAAVSELYRKNAGLGGDDGWIDIQLGAQLRWIDENGMYMDGEGDVRHPIMYDIVSRGLFAMLLNAGYRGRYRDEIDGCLKRAGLLTLKMQSPSGEMGFGGRSNQFIHNEAFVAVVYEYEARRYAAEGNTRLAAEFKAATARLLEIVELWLSMEPISHVKNRFPIESRVGCEEYAYFDKYMITVASNLYAAYSISDDSIAYDAAVDVAPSVFVTSEHFHKLFLKAGGYGIQFDLNADPHYDACGVGRVHRAGAPTAVCISVPCPRNPSYTVDIENPLALSLSEGVMSNGKLLFAADGGANLEVTELFTDNSSAHTVIRTRFPDGQSVTSEYTVSERGVEIVLTGEDTVAYMLPALYFDGEAYSNITHGENALTVSYMGWTCQYSINAEIVDSGKTGANRNGHYKMYYAQKAKRLDVKIEILNQ